MDTLWVVLQDHCGIVQVLMVAIDGDDKQLWLRYGYQELLFI